MRFGSSSSTGANSLSRIDIDVVVEVALPMSSTAHVARSSDIGQEGGWYGLVGRGADVCEEAREVDLVE